MFLTLHTAVPLVNNDSIHGIRSRFGTSTLTQGYHSIAVTYFQGTNGYNMELWWTNNAGLVRERGSEEFLYVHYCRCRTCPGFADRFNSHSCCIQQDRT